LFRVGREQEAADPTHVEDATDSPAWPSRSRV
jgi:hypothetical protein